MAVLYAWGYSFVMCLLNLYWSILACFLYMKLLQAQQVSCILKGVRFTLTRLANHIVSRSFLTNKMSTEYGGEARWPPRSYNVLL